MFVLLTLESFGLPLPGETALIACSVLASQGSFSIVAVIVVGILGRGRRRQPRLLGRAQGRAAAARAVPVDTRYAEKYLPRGERFFAKHGGKAVFFGRFVAVLRVTAAWIAGISHMHWWRFFALEPGRRDRVGDRCRVIAYSPRRRRRRGAQPLRAVRGRRRDRADGAWLPGRPVAREARRRGGRLASRRGSRGAATPG